MKRSEGEFAKGSDPEMNLNIQRPTVVSLSDLLKD